MAKNENVPPKVKTENPIKRLASFKAPRDLNLSQFNNPIGEARTKKVFVPNLNATRRKQNETDDGSGGGGGGTSSSEQRRGLERGGKRGRGARPKREYVQSSGVFSEGLAPQLKTRSSRGSYGGGGGGGSGGGGSGGVTTASSRLRLNLKAGLSGSEEEDLVMKELLRDDFIDDTHQPDMDNCPVHLPLIKLENMKLESLKSEKMEKPKPDSSTQNGIKIKAEPGTENSLESESSNSSSSIYPVTVGDLRPSTAQIIAQAHSTDFIFFQMPNRMPQLKVPETTQSKVLKSKNKDETEDEEHQSLRSLPAGRIGTLQILRSGRARLLLGDVKFELEPGTQVAFKQELVSVDVDKEKKTGSMVNMGKISSRMLVTPDWASLLPAPPR